MNYCEQYHPDWKSLMNYESKNYKQITMYIEELQEHFRYYKWINLRIIDENVQCRKDRTYQLIAKKPEVY